MARVQLDVAYENDQELEEFIAGLPKGITVNTIGEANGWPIMEFTGTKKALKALIKKSWQDPDLYDDIID